MPTQLTTGNTDVAMNIAGIVNECDMSQEKYSSAVMGVHILARDDATGRVCVVAHVGPADSVGLEMSTRKEAEDWVADYPGGWVDF